MGDNTHGGSKKNLLGENPAPELIELLSNEKQVTKDTPPMLHLAHMGRQRRESRKLPRFRRRPPAQAGVPFDLHVYQKGAHGIGLGGGRAGGVLHPWAADCLYWLKAQGFVR